MSRIAPIGLFLILAIFLAIGLTRDPSVIPTQMIDRELPKFNLTELQDETAKIGPADLQGDMVLLNIFGSWCAACLQEHGLLMRLAEDERVRLVGVNWRDTREDATAWLARYGNPYDTIIFDADSDLAIELGVTGAPETFLIDTRGRIRYKHVGPILDADWQGELSPRIDLLRASLAQATE